MTTPRPPAPASDDELAARLARLQARRPPSPSSGTGKGSSRRHPAARARAAALLLTVASTAGLAALFADLDSSHASSGAIAALPSPTAPTTGAPTTTTQAFDGSVVNTKYGPVQVQAQLSGGRITDVAVITYPDRENKSRNINARALPQLRTEVLTAQRASVDTVSGATYTSTAYRQSLQAALDQARATGATTVA